MKITHDLIERNQALLIVLVVLVVSVAGLVEIVSGLKEGDRYAAKGAFILKSEVKKGELLPTELLGVTISNIAEVKEK